MLQDPVLAAALATLKAAILHGGLSIAPAVGEDDPDYETAVEIADFCRRNIEGLERPFITETLWDMLDALAVGNRVAEQIYELRSDGPDAGRLCLRALKVKPRRTTAFVVDAYLNVVGLLAILPGHPWALLSGTLITDPAAVENLLPRSKFAVLTHAPKDGDPRGQSLLRAAYFCWWFKQQVWPEFLAYMSQFARPTLVGTTAEGASDDEELDDNGDPILDPVTGDPATVKPEVALNAALQNVRNGTTIAIPFGAKVEFLQVQGEGAPFLSAFEMLDRQMTLSVLLQTLATGEAQFGTRAQSQTHQDVMGLRVMLGRSMTEEFIVRDILRRLTEYNWGSDALHLVPKASLGDTAPEDLPALLTAYAAAGWKADPSQYPGIDAALSQPKRSPESIEHAQAMQEAQLQGIQAASQGQDGEPAAKPGEKPSNGKQPTGAAA